MIVVEFLRLLSETIETKDFADSNNNFTISSDFMVLDHFTEKSFHRNFLTERPFDSKKQSVNFTTPKSCSPRFQKSTKTKTFFKSVFNCNIYKKTGSRDASVLDHFTEKSFHRQILTESPLTETLFDRTPFDRIPFDRKFIRPNRRLTERRLTESSFYRKVI
jgi:hypothetical protein